MKRKIPSLTKAGCLARQSILAEIIKRNGLDSVLITNPKLVHYFTGFWGRSIMSPVFWMNAQNQTILSIPYQANNLFADDIIIYPSNRMGTLDDQQLYLAIEPVLKHLPSTEKIGFNEYVPGTYLSHFEWFDVSIDLLKMRRKKHPDEIDLITFAIEACEHSYSHVPEMLQEGIDEIELWANIQKLAADFVGETLGEIGNDYQIGSAGSKPRNRKAQSGEMAVLDVSIVVRGYASDMCRSFVVGGEATPIQLEAQNKIIETLQFAESKVKLGSSCRKLHEVVIELINGWHGFEFRHHLGHGIGLSNHEAPRINLEWNDHFELSDVFAMEPGMYGKELQAGLRIEEVYHLSETGLNKLTKLPLTFF